MKTHLKVNNINNSVPQNIDKNWIRKIGSWLGHLWSFCSTSLACLVNRVSSITHKVFSKSSEKPQEQDSPSLKSKMISPQRVQKEKPNKEKERKKTVENIENDLNLLDLFPDEDVPIETAIEASPIQEDTKAELVSQVKSPIEENQPAVSKLPEQVLEVDQSHPQTQSDINKTETKPEPPHEDIDSKSLITADLNQIQNEKPGSSSQFHTRFRRRYRDRAQVKSRLTNTPVKRIIPPNNVKTPTTAVKITPPKHKVISPKYMLIEAGGGGDCQLLSFLKGLEMQYPELAGYEENGKLIPYTAQKLRKMGVEFAREQIDGINKEGPGTYAQKVLEYLDTDRQEYNDDEIAIVNRVEQSYKTELAKLDKSLKDKKLTEENHKRQKNLIRTKYAKIIQNLEKRFETHRIHSDEEFLKHLEKPGFYCSTLHLFALSIKFQLPIHVHDQYGVKGHEVQVFNKTKSQKEPIHLYRVGKNHYQLMLFT